MIKDVPRKLTQSQMLELITDIAYQQSTRIYSGFDWFSKFFEKINKYQYPNKKER